MHNFLSSFSQIAVKIIGTNLLCKRESRLSLQFDIYENCINKYIETLYSGIESVLQLN